MRSCGVLLPVSSLPSEYGIGCFSKEAYEFVDKLSEAGQGYWQILPLGPTSYGDSPYQSFSTYAGNPYFVDLEELMKLGLIKEAELKKFNFGKNTKKIDYEKIYNSRFKALRIAFDNAKKLMKAGKFKLDGSETLEEFKKANSLWIENYSLFMAIKDSLNGVSWSEWEEGLRLRKPETLKKYKEKLADEIEFYVFIQWMFDVQWKKLKKYANDKGIKIIGDVPIYVAFDSADAWANPELFQFDENFTPIAVAGCPPDAFSATGQLWGNPLYDWDYHKKTKYEWWMKRLARAFELYDTVRIDHFRGFDTYYSIPYGRKDAVVGKWKKGAGFALFARMKEVLGDVDVIAEDLGYLTPSVIKLVKRTGYPGMKVIHFAFYGGAETTYLPHNHVANSVVYTGTHDNDTTLGWYRSLDKKVKKFANEYLDIQTEDEKEVVWELLRNAYMSVGNLTIIPMQDFLCLGSEARINTPSTLGGNWEWRMGKKDFSSKLAKRMLKLAKTYGRAAEITETKEQ